MTMLCAGLLSLGCLPSTVQRLTTHMTWSDVTSGLDVWPLISGQTTTSPRFELPVSNYTYINGQVAIALLTFNASTHFHAVQSYFWCGCGCGRYVHITYVHKSSDPTPGWTGPVYPNATSNLSDPNNVVLDCTDGCLVGITSYNIMDVMACWAV